MTATTKQREKIERTEHPHIVKSAGVMGGFPRIEDTRLSVLQIFRMYEAGHPIAKLAEDYVLTPAQVHDAISYGYDHPDELAAHEARHTLRSVLQRADMVYVEGRLIPRRALKEGDIPPGAQAYTWETLPAELDE
jgi:uncharacterized protein (DUF433 family)